MIDLKKSELDTINEILNEKKSKIQVLAFGSRVNGRAKKYSDLDLVLKGDDVIDWEELELLKDKFSQSDLPFMVDIVDWFSISEKFKNIIEKSCVAI